MNDLSEIHRYISKKRPEGLIIDTNLLILFLIGRFDESFIKTCSLTKGYDNDDYQLLSKIVTLFRNRVIVTPYIISEISNLSRRDIKNEKLNSYIKAVVVFLSHSSVSERNVELKKIISIEVSCISNFGFTDMAIFELSKSENMPFITDDSQFYQFAVSKAVPCIKFKIIKNADLNSVFSKS